MINVIQKIYFYKKCEIINIYSLKNKFYNLNKDK